MHTLLHAKLNEINQLVLAKIMKIFYISKHFDVLNLILLNASLNSSKYCVFRNNPVILLRQTIYIS